MNKPLVILVTIILLIIIGAGAVYTRRLPQSQTEYGPSSISQKAPESGTSMTSLKDLLTMGKNQICTFAYDNGKTGSNGTAYIAGKKVAVDFNTTMGSDVTAGHMIQDGAYTYIWTSRSPQGIKMEVTASMESQLQQFQNEKNTGNNQYMDPSVKTQYSCKDWSVDATKFIPPSNVSFTDFSEQQKALQNMMKGEKGTTSQQCAACDKIPDEAKAACRKALQCP